MQKSSQEREPLGTLSLRVTNLQLIGEVIADSSEAIATQKANLEAKPSISAKIVTRSCAATADFGFSFIVGMASDFLGPPSENCD